ncbi:ATP synthase subunit E [Astrocystis sublimbata]|nr:ATP synthase subunit E [Astrocystis sublimbata]
MSTTSGVNVLRYSALAFGVFYGFTHQRAITSSQRAAVAKKEYEHKQQLINKAKAEYTKSKSPAAAPTPNSGLNQDPTSPNFDFESYFEAVFEQKV